MIHGEWESKGEDGGKADLIFPGVKGKTEMTGYKFPRKHNDMVNNDHRIPAL